MLLVLVAAVAGGLVLLDRNGDDSRADTTGTDDTAAVILEPVALEVPDPFTASVAIDERALPSDPDSTGDGTGDSTQDGTETGEVTAGGGGVVMTASSAGLYGGTLDQQSCDPDALASFLEESPAKAAAWAAVQGIEVEDIRAFVDGLTPVLLRRDTRVLNHGYVDGVANPYASVLQAGTAVMVDAFGVPRAKCSCGNPLAEAPAVTTATRYTGARWPGFDPSIVVVVKATVEVTVIVLVDVTTGRPFSRPVGTVGTADASDPGEEVEPPASEGTDAEVLAEIASIAGVSNGPTEASIITLPAARITAPRTYHWNDARGVAPGTISLRASDGTRYGPFATTGLEGQGGVPNAYWVAITSFRVPAGTYEVLDSDPSTWAWAPDTGGRGMTTVWGVRDAAPDPTPAPASRGPEAKVAVTSLFCAEVDQYVERVTARETALDLYRVRVLIVLDSGQWTAWYDVDLSDAAGPQVSTRDADSAGLLC